MKMRYLLIYSLCVLALLDMQGLYAQMGIPVGQYTEFLPYYNAASIGRKDELHIRALHNRQLEGVEGSAKSFLLMGDMPISFLGHRHSVGVQMDNVSFGAFKDTGLAVRYALGMNLGKAGLLRVGLGLRLQSSVIDGSHIYIPNGIEGSSQADEAIPLGEVSGRGLDAQFGLFYRFRGLDIGLGVSNLFDSNIIIEQKYKREQSRLYSLFALYRLGRSDKALNWEPSILFATTGMGLYRLDLKLGLWYHGRFYISGVYRPLQAFGANLGIKLGKAYIGYQFESPTGVIRSGSWGNHELFISYAIPVDLGEKRNLKYKSVRLL